MAEECLNQRRSMHVCKKMGCPIKAFFFTGDRFSLVGCGGLEGPTTTIL